MGDEREKIYGHFPTDICRSLMLEYDLAGELVCEDRRSSAVTSSFKTVLVQIVFDLMYYTESILI